MSNDFKDRITVDCQPLIDILSNQKPFDIVDFRVSEAEWLKMDEGLRQEYIRTYIMEELILYGERLKWEYVP